MSQSISNHLNSFFIDLLNQRQSVKIPVRGMSMFPFLLSGDVVLVRPVKDVDFKIGTIVVYKSGTNLVLHRLVGQNKPKGMVYTRGDGLVHIDKPVNIADVVGVVAGIVESRWPLAKVAYGPWAVVWAFIAPVTGPMFRLVVKIYGFFKS